MRYLICCGFVVWLAAGLAACRAPVKWTPPAEPRLENLIRQDLSAEFTADREVVVSYVEVPPHTRMELHWHPGDVCQYFLDGQAALSIVGLPPILGTPGKVVHVPYRSLHTGVAGRQGVKLLVFRVHAKGEPVRYLEHGAAQDH